MAPTARSQTACTAAGREVVGAVVFVTVFLFGHTTLEAMGQRLVLVNEMDPMHMHSESRHSIATDIYFGAFRTESINCP